MAGLDYILVQDLINFGRGLAGDFVGQPMLQYRVTNTSSGDIVQPAHLRVPNNAAASTVNVKISAQNSRKVVENESLHSDTFEMLASSQTVLTEDILLQNDPIYGANTSYCVASRRPLKPMLAVRVESMCHIYRYRDNRDLAQPSRGYGGSTMEGQLPFVLTNGVLVPATLSTATPTEIPCGITYIGQIKNQKPSRLPEDSQSNWWYVYVPMLPGLDRVGENDIISCKFNANEEPARYRVHTSNPVAVGLRGVFCLCERVTG